MPIAYPEVSQNSNGGTEILCRELEKRIDPSLLEQVQIIPSRVRELDEGRIRILWLHDLPEDPESHHLRNEGWRKFHKIVCVSNWQMQAYAAVYRIPWNKMVVLKNAIQPLELLPWEERPEVVNLIYHTTPHRGLQLLVPIFEKLCEDYSGRVHLDVYSSFKLYGWDDRDEPYRELFEKVEAMPDATYHGAVSQEIVRGAVSHSHVFTYPSVWMETSCLCMMEAMSAGLVCLHPNLGALFETGAGFTMEYQWDEDPSAHASHHYEILKSVVERVLSGDESLTKMREFQKMYTDGAYSWDNRVKQWEALIRSLLSQPRELPKEEWVYRPNI